MFVVGVERRPILPKNGFLGLLQIKKQDWPCSHVMTFGAVPLWCIDIHVLLVSFTVQSKQ